MRVFGRSAVVLVTVGLLLCTGLVGDPARAVGTSGTRASQAATSSSAPVKALPLRKAAKPIASLNYMAGLDGRGRMLVVFTTDSAKVLVKYKVPKKTKGKTKPNSWPSPGR